MKGNLSIGIMLTIGGAVGGSVMWVYNLVSPVKEATAENDKDIAVLQEAVKCLPEMKADIKATNENLIRLMERSGVQPVARNLATSTTIK